VVRSVEWARCYERVGGETVDRGTAAENFSIDTGVWRLCCSNSPNDVCAQLTIEARVDWFGSVDSTACGRA